MTQQPLAAAPPRHTRCRRAHHRRAQPPPAATISPNTIVRSFSFLISHLCPLHRPSACVLPLQPLRMLHCLLLRHSGPCHHARPRPSMASSLPWSNLSPLVVSFLCLSTPPCTATRHASIVRVHLPAPPVCPTRSRRSLALLATLLVLPAGPVMRCPTEQSSRTHYGVKPSLARVIPVGHLPLWRPSPPSPSGLSLLPEPHAPVGT